MGSNSFGKIFTITTWGESHGKAVGVVVDGCPAGLSISEDDIQQELIWRKPGLYAHTSPRKEKDIPEILSGVFEGKTSGTPICILIKNHDVDSAPYEPLKELLRPGHANFTYLEKYGLFDYRGSGRASARETVCRVAAGAIAKKLLSHFDIHLTAYIKACADIVAKEESSVDPLSLKKHIRQNSLFCPDEVASAIMMEKLEEARQQGDSVGGIVKLVTTPLPIGLGEPIYAKLEALLGSAMLSIPASKGVSIGSGFQAASMRGSTHNDLFTTDSSKRVVTSTNHAGGILGGISSGMPLLVEVAFKPTSSIFKEQKTIDVNKNPCDYNLLSSSRHDPCVALRAVAVVEAMAALVLADALLMNRSTRL